MEYALSRSLSATDPTSACYREASDAMRLTRKALATLQDKKQDFWLGFWLWWAANLLVLVALDLGLYAIGNAAFQVSGATSTPTQIAAVVLGLIPLVVNIAAFIYPGLTQTQNALAALWAFGAAIAVIVVLRPFVSVAACFVALGST